MGCRPMPSTGSEGVDGVPTHAKHGFGGGSMGCQPISRGSEGVRRGGEGFENGSRVPPRPTAGWKAHVCLPGSASPPACRGSASPPACRAPLHLLPAGALLHLLPAGAPLHLQPAGAVALTSPTAGPSRSAACQTGRSSQPSPPDARTPANVAPLIGQKKTRHLPAAPRPKPDRLDNPNRPMSILSNSEPALCALAPAPGHQAPPVPVPSPALTSSYARTQVAAATPKPARQPPRLAVFPGQNHRNGEPPPLHAFRHLRLPPASSPPFRFPSLSASRTFRLPRIPSNRCPPAPCAQTMQSSSSSRKPRLLPRQRNGASACESGVGRGASGWEDCPHCSPRTTQIDTSNTR
jgi:hypothetical protein